MTDGSLKRDLLWNKTVARIIWSICCENRDSLFIEKSNQYSFSVSKTIKPNLDK
jgi:hypothetical protein